MAVDLLAVEAVSGRAIMGEARREPKACAPIPAIASRRTSRVRQRQSVLPCRSPGTAGDHRGRGVAAEAFVRSLTKLKGLPGELLEDAG